MGKMLEEVSITAVQITGLVTELNPWLILEGGERLVHTQYYTMGSFFIVHSERSSIGQSLFTC